MDVHAIAALAGQGAALYATIVAADAGSGRGAAFARQRCPPICRPPSRHSGGARPGGCGGQGARSGPCRFLSQHQSDRLSPVSRRSAFPILSAAMPSPWASGPAIHLPIFDAGKIRAQYAGATAALDVAVADYNGAVLNAVKQAADAMTEVKSLPAQRADQQAALDSATRAFALARSATRMVFPTRFPC